MVPIQSRQRIFFAVILIGLLVAAPVAWSGARLEVGPEVQTDTSCPNAAGRAIQHELAAGRHHTRNWANSWGSLWALATVGQAVAAVSYHDPELRKDLWVGSASSALGMIPTWIIPPKINAEDEDSDPCPTFEHEKMLLESYGENDEANSGPIAHAANLGVNIGIAAILGAGFGHWNAAGISLGLGVVMGEMMILTYPRSAIHIMKQNEYGKGASVTIAPSPLGPILVSSLSF